jgi:hypothetical protein
MTAATPTQQPRITHLSHKSIKKLKRAQVYFPCFLLLYLVILATLTPSLIFTVNLIFAVTKEQYHIYDQLNKHVEGASCGVLSNDSSNVVELVQEQYNVSTIFTDSISHCNKSQYVVGRK